MGSGVGSFTLAKILGRGYGLQEEEEDSLQRAKTLEDLEQSLEATQAEEMPLEELLALYGYEVSDRISGDNGEPTELPAHLPDPTLDKDRMVKDLLSGEEESPPDDLTPSVTSHTPDLFRRHLRAPVPVGEDRVTSGSLSDEDSEGSSSASDKGRKDIMVGLQYQAVIPPLNPLSYQERAYEKEDQLLWAPGVLAGEAVEAFLLRAQRWSGEPGGGHTPAAGDVVKDSEQALYELVKCSFNTEEALRRLMFNVKVLREELCAWSEEECRSFEHGYRIHGKNFHLIQANKVRTRSVGECVEYYYMWKKSERHDYFTLQTTKLGRKRYSLQTDTMEDGDQDGEGGSCSHSPPPGPGTGSQLDPPSPPEGLDPAQPAAGAELRGREPLSPRSAQHQEPQEPSARCPSPADLPSPAPLDAPQGPPAPELLGPGFYQLQLGPFGSDGPFALPAVAPAPPSAFGAIGGFLGPPPVQHPRSLTQ